MKQILKKITIISTLMLVSSLSFASETLFESVSTPSELRISNDDADITIIKGNKFKIYYQKVVIGGNSSEAEGQEALKSVKVTYDEFTGHLRVKSGHLNYGRATAMITVEIPHKISLKIVSVDGNVVILGVTLERMNARSVDGDLKILSSSFESLKLESEDGDVLLVGSRVAFSSRIITEDGNITVHDPNSLYGYIVAKVSGDGRISGERDLSSKRWGDIMASNSLLLATEDGDIEVWR